MTSTENTPPPVVRVITTRAGARKARRFFSLLTGRQEIARDDFLERSQHSAADHGVTRIETLADGRERWEFSMSEPFVAEFDLAAECEFDSDALERARFAKAAARLASLGFRPAEPGDLPRLRAALAGCWDGTGTRADRELSEEQLIPCSLVSPDLVVVPEGAIGTLGHLHQSGQAIATPIGSGWGNLETALWAHIRWGADCESYRVKNLQVLDTERAPAWVAQLMDQLKIYGTPRTVDALSQHQWSWRSAYAFPGARPYAYAELHGIARFEFETSDEHHEWSDEDQREARTLRRNYRSALAGDDPIRAARILAEYESRFGKMP